MPGMKPIAWEFSCSAWECTDASIPTTAPIQVSAASPAEARKIAQRLGWRRCNDRGRAFGNGWWCPTHAAKAAASEKEYDAKHGVA